MILLDEWCEFIKVTVAQYGRTTCHTHACDGFHLRISGPSADAHTSAHAHAHAHAHTHAHAHAHARRPSLQNAEIKAGTELGRTLNEEQGEHVKKK